MNTIDTSDSAGLWIGHDKMFDFLKACASDVFTLSACIHMPLSGAVTQFIHASAEFMSHISISMNNGIRLTQYYFFHASVKFTDSKINMLNVFLDKNQVDAINSILFNVVRGFVGNFSETGAIANRIYKEILDKANNHLNVMGVIPPPKQVRKSFLTISSRT